MTVWYFWIPIEGYRRTPQKSTEGQRNGPSGYNPRHDIAYCFESLADEYGPIKCQNRQLYKAHGKNVQELNREHDLSGLSKDLSIAGRRGGGNSGVTQTFKNTLNS